MIIKMLSFNVVYVCGNCNDRLKTYVFNVSHERESGECIESEAALISYASYMHRFISCII